jgi:eukaryotic-like serine/threonine-protein kinase
VELVAARQSASRHRLGRYEIVRHLAQGGMADVLLARTSGIEGFARHVVIKRIRTDQASDERYVEMFLDEARLAAALHHHNIVQVNDIGQEHGQYFFAMEYVHGEDARTLLARVSERGQLVPLEHVLAIVCAAAAGLHHAHEQRGPDRTPLCIVHRDVSPANIMIGYDGGVKVADFGIAKAAHRTTETRSGTLKGKVAYMSPEQCVGEAVDRRSDVFSLGIVLYELVTVRRLFKADNDFLTMAAVVLGHIPPPSKYRPDLPPELEAIICKALANKPEERFQTADELRLALEELAARHGLRMSSTALADYMRELFGSRPEPWLEEDDEPEIEIDVDFDGSASGLVAPPSLDALTRLALPNRSPEETPAPIARARRRFESVAPPVAPAIDRATEPVLVAPVVAASPRRTRRWITFVAVAGLAGIAAALLWIARGPDAPDVAAEVPVEPTPVGKTVELEVIDPPTEPAAPAVEPDPPASEPVVVAEPPAEPPARKSRPKSRPRPKKQWDPGALFPD